MLLMFTVYLLCMALSLLYHSWTMSNNELNPHFLWADKKKFLYIIFKRYLSKI